jgi:predicted permease
MPAAAAPAIAFDRSNDARRFLLIGRLRHSATVAQARDEVARVQARLDPPTVRRQREPVRVVSVRERVVESVRPVLVAFAAAAGIVLLIACANVATILVGRTLGRRRELAVRRALGASPRQLFASILSESFLISLAGGALGVAIAVIAVRVFARWAAGIIPRLGDIHLDWAALGFTVATTMVAALLSAVPAVRTLHRASAPSLRLGGWASSPLDRRSRGALIIVQIALAVVLLTGGALLARTIVGLLRGELGISAPGTIVTQLLLTTGPSFSAGDRAPLLDDVLRRVRSLPGVTAAGAGSNLPPDNASIEVRVTLAGEAGDRAHRLSMGSATPGYLPAIGARLLEGRDFRDGDDGAGHLFTVISESAARALLPGAPAVGRQLPFSLPGLRDRGRPTVIGIVRDIKYLGLESPAGPAIYAMWSHFPAGRTFLAVRTQEPAAKMASSLRGILRERDPRIPLMPVRTLEEVVERSVSDRRLRALLGGSVALLAFAVAMVGLSGSLMRIVSERREELAIRAALGASPARAVRTIVREGILLAGIGVAVGCVAALAMGRALSSLLHGVSPHDPATLAAVAAFVGAVSLLASYIPARRAARVDPLLLLRSE